MEYYDYENLAGVPCSAYIRDTVAASEMTNKEYVGTTWNPDFAEDTTRLRISWESALIPADKTLLDGIVSDSLGKVPIYKERERIMAEILMAASLDPACLGRLLDALDSHTSMAVALDNYNYPLARARVYKVFTDGAITEADMNLVLGCIPESLFGTP